MNLGVGQTADDVFNEADLFGNEIVKNVYAIFKIDELGLGHFLRFHTILVNDQNVDGCHDEVAR